MREKVTVIFTCFNRKNKTIVCMQSLKEKNPAYDLDFIVVDDNSTDGTVPAIEALGYPTTILSGDGNLFWAGGMRVGIGHCLQRKETAAYVLLVNDDVHFYDGILDDLICRSKANENAIVVGATCDKNGQYTYGGHALHNNWHGDLYYTVLPSEEVIACDVFNCNCTLIPYQAMKKMGNFDAHYVHDLADFDYSFIAKRNGIRIISSTNYVGVCELNAKENTWNDKTLSRCARIKAKESVKGAPTKPWFYFLHKNFGLFAAIQYSVTPYIRILLKK